MISICPFSTLTCRKFLNACALFFLLLFGPSSAYADQQLVFKPADNHYKSRIVAAFVQKTNAAERGPFLVAKLDLNADGVPEYFVKSALQAKQQNHWLIALKRRTPTFLTKIPATKIIISDKKIYGIRKLIVYNQPGNDFHREIFSWNPFHFRFEPEK